MTNLLYSAKHYQIKCAKDREIIEQIYEEVKKSAQNAIYRNIGDIFFTTRTDTEINGAVECNGGTYNTTDFEGEQTVGNLLASGSLPYVSLSEYESLVSANGSCRAFGWDGGDSFRVPLLNDVYIEAGTALTAGEFINESLPNIKGAISCGVVSEPYQEGAIYREEKKQGYDGAYAGVDRGMERLALDASLSSSTYQDNAKVKPDSVRYRAMVQLVNGATDQAVITATSALQQIANKANSDLSNVASVNPSFKEQSVGWGMPDYNAGVSITNGTTIVKDGLIAFRTANLRDTEKAVYINGNKLLTGAWSSSNTYITFCFPVSKNDIITFDSGSEAEFYPLKGVN